MKCPYCKNEMNEGALKCYRCAPMFEGHNGRKFTFGAAKLFVNTTKETWYCENCDSLIIKKVGNKIEH